MGRRSLWSPRPLLESDEGVLEALEKRYYASGASNRRTRARVCREFISAARMSGLEREIPKSYRRWIGSLRRAGMKWSTIDSYGMYVLNFLTRLPLLITEKHEIRAAHGSVRLAHADEDARSAPILNKMDVQKYITFAFEDGLGDLGRSLSVMTMCGARAADTLHLRRRQISIGEDDRTLEVQWRITKNRRRRSLRFYTLFDAFQVVGLRPHEIFCKHLREGDPEERLFVLGAQQINDGLKELKHLHNLPTATSYSFRSFFIRQVLAYTKYDLKAATAYTGHINDRILAAHYQIGRMGGR